MGEFLLILCKSVPVNQQHNTLNTNNLNTLTSENNTNQNTYQSKNSDFIFLDTTVCETTTTQVSPTSNGVGVSSNYSTLLIN